MHVNTSIMPPEQKCLVLETHLRTSGSTPHRERGFVLPKFWGVVRLHCPRMVSGGVGLPGRMASAAGSACFNIPAHPTRLKPQKVDSLIQPGIQTMTTLVTPAQAAPTLASAHEAALIELHCAAHNAAVLATLYTTRKQYPQAARKTRQHLQALRQLAKLEGGVA